MPTAILPEPLELPDLGVTLEPELDGTAWLDFPGFGKKPLTIADMDALEAWLKLLPGRATHEVYRH